MKTDHRRRAKQKAQPRYGHRPSRKPNQRVLWQRHLDQYLMRARAASQAGERIEAENLFQHAEHYFRLIKGTAA